jgi:hypothetical protein
VNRNTLPDSLVAQCRLGFAVYLLGIRVVLIDILAADSLWTWLLVPIDIGLIAILTTWRTAHVDPPPTSTTKETTHEAEASGATT